MSKWLKANCGHCGTPAKTDIAKIKRERFRTRLPWLLKEEPYSHAPHDVSYGNPYKGSGGTGEASDGGAPGIHTDIYPNDYGQQGGVN